MADEVRDPPHVFPLGHKEGQHKTGETKQKVRLAYYRPLRVGVCGRGMMGVMRCFVLFWATRLFSGKRRSEGSVCLGEREARDSGEGQKAGLMGAGYISSGRAKYWQDQSGAILMIAAPTDRRPAPFSCALPLRPLPRPSRSDPTRR